MVIEKIDDLDCGDAISDIVIACCRDETDIITNFIDFYIDQGFDRISIIDNGSVDGTFEKIINHPHQERIILLRDLRPGYDMRLLEYYKMFSTSNTRWVFFIDVDEFIPLPGGIKAYASELPPNVTLLEFPIAEMQPIFDESDEESNLKTTRREANFQKEIKVVWKAVNVSKIFCGKHDVVIEPRVSYRDEQVYIRHYHTRSEQQFKKKLRNRIQTEKAIGSKAGGLSLFSKKKRKEWIDRSRRLLQPGGWRVEERRLKKLKTIRNTVVADWFSKREQRIEKLCLSTIIPLNGEKNGWYCFCARDYRLTEGHTGPDHLVVFLAPNWKGGSLDSPVYETTDAIPVRLHSECLLGEVFSTSRCDCAYQLATATEIMEKEGAGVIIYLRQEGRGIGLFDKIQSLAIDHEDTFHRNDLIGRPEDARGYRLAGEVLRRLGIKSAKLISGNLSKVNALRAEGIDTVVENRLLLDRISPEAFIELQAKIRKGYVYDLIGSNNKHER
jgi:GTP cyclohydrolase II